MCPTVLCLFLGKEHHFGEYLPLLRNYDRGSSKYRSFFPMSLAYLIKVQNLVEPLRLQSKLKSIRNS